MEKNLKDLYDTSLPDAWARQVYEDFLYDLGPVHFEKMAYTLFVATAKVINSFYTNNIESKKNPVAFVFYAVDKTQFIGAAICEYFENEDPDSPGNYSFVWTYDEADIPESAVKLSLDNSDTQSYFNGVSATAHRFQFAMAGDLISLMNSVLTSIKKWLDENASETEEVGFKIDGVLEATVEVVDGVKCYALCPDGLVKALIKNDTSIEK